MRPAQIAREIAGDDATHKTDSDASMRPAQIAREIALHEEERQGAGELQ